MKPIVAIYSTFLQRSYDNILHDVALQKLPVIFCIDRAGLNRADGATHHGVFDVAFLSQAPGLTLDAPTTVSGLENALSEALNRHGPTAIRYPSGTECKDIITHFELTESCHIFQSDYSKEEKETLDALIITYGKVTVEAIKAAKIARDREGKTIGIILLHRLMPYAECAVAIAPFIPEKSVQIIFLEEEIKVGGMGMMLSEELRLQEKNLMGNKTYNILATVNPFATRRKGESIYDSFGVSANFILDKLF